MSVILYDTNRQIMVSDTRAYSGSSRPIGNKSKIYRIKSGPFEGSILGVTSNQPGLSEAFCEWVTGGMSKDDYAPSNPVFDAIFVKPSGEVYFFSDSYYMAGPLRGDVFTIGSGAKYALGAFDAHQNAESAIKTAIRFDEFCGEPIETVHLIEPNSYKAGELHD